MSEHDETTPDRVQRGPSRRGSEPAAPRPPGRKTTAPIESVAPPGGPSSGAWAPHRTSDRPRPETAELLPPVRESGIAAPLGRDEFDDFESDGSIERTAGFDEVNTTLDEADRAELRAAVARSLEAEREALGAIFDDPSGTIDFELGGVGGDDPSGTVDFDARATQRYRDAAPGLRGSTADFGELLDSSLDASLDAAIDAAPLRENPTDVNLPRPDTRPLGGMDPPEWAAHVLKACRSLEAVHRDGRTFGGRFDLDEEGVVGAHQPARPGTDGFALDVRRMHHLVGVVAEAVRAGSDNSPTSMVVADALTEVKPAESAAALTRGLTRALAARTTRQRKRLAAEFEAVDARRRALATQRRLRADLAARLARLDASISAQAAAVARDEDRVQMLTVERRVLDGLVELSGLDPETLEETGAREAEVREEAQSTPSRSADETRGDKVRRLLGA